MVKYRTLLRGGDAMTNCSGKRSSDFVNVLVIVLTGLALTAPIILYGFPNGHDGMVHVARFRHFADQLWSGEFYPRWLLGMNGGLGSPTFFFYGPVPYYVASVFHLIPGESHGWFQLGLACALATVTAGIASYVWLKNVAGAKPAAIAALLYMAMPYALAVDLYRRAALGEYFTFVWMPLILHFTNRLARGHRNAFIGLTIAYSLLVLTHLPITLVFSMVPGVYALWVADRDYAVKAGMQTGAALALGIGLSATYLIPAMTTQDSIDVENLNLFSEKHFLFSGAYRSLLTPSFSGLAMFLSQVTAATIGVAYCGFVVARTNLQNIVLRKESYFWFLIVILSLWMMLPLSKPIWTTLSVMQKIQFPWRLMAVMTVATAALIALGVSALHRPLKLLAGIHLAIAGLLIVSWAWPTVSIVKQYFGSKRSFVQSNPYNDLSMENAGFQPRWMSRDLFNPAVIENLVKNPAKATIMAGLGSVTTQQWSARKIVFRTYALTDIWLVVKHLYYPGWTAVLAGESSPLPVRASERFGLLNVWVRSGTHEVRLELARGKTERIGQAVSGVALTVILFLTLWFRLSRPKSTRAQEI